MQGGHGDEFHSLGFMIGRSRSCTEEGSGYESEISISESISLGSRIDTVIHYLREFLGIVLAWPIALACGWSTIYQFRKHKLKRVRTGTNFVCNLQKWRNPFFDWYFQVCSFFAEEEFYLLSLPMIIWNIDHALGRRLTLVVCIGLLIGNYVKDVFRLPRPKSPPVWRPRNSEKIDSTSLGDFGFPSTHTMNGISNSAFVYLYMNKGQLAVNWSFSAALLYATSLTFSRLYLGAHTPTDIRGGIVLGIIVALGSQFSESFEKSYVAIENFNLKMAVGISIFLLLNPQPRPRTPTFEQNALVCGLIWGCMAGTRLWLLHGDATSSLDDKSVLHIQFRHDPESFQEFTSSILIALYSYGSALLTYLPGLAIVLRTLIGYAFVLVIRAITKSGLILILLSALNIQIKPKVVKAPDLIARHKKNDDYTANVRSTRKSRVVHLITRDIDRVGNAFVKLVTYTLIAFNIVYTVPYLFVLLGLQ